MLLRLEVTVEPFVDGQPGPHVHAAIDALRAAGLHPDVGPFGTTVEAPLERITVALGALASAAFEADATSMTMSVRRVHVLSPETTAFLDALRPVLSGLGATLVEPDRMRAGDQPVSFQGAVVAGVRPGEPAADLARAVPRLLEQAEQFFGLPLAQLGREDKQRAARWLADHGAFSLRNATELIADAMGVSRGTIYNYLSVVRDHTDAAAPVADADGTRINHSSGLH